MKDEEDEGNERMYKGVDEDAKIKEQEGEGKRQME